MLLFTWNLHRTEAALRLTLEYLSKAGSCIAALQELPPKPAKNGAWSSHGLLGKAELKRWKLRLLGDVVGPGRVVLIASDDVSMANFKAAGEDRLAMAKLTGKDWDRLFLVGFHAVDRLNHPTEFERGAHSALVRREVDEFWTEDRPFVMMGDFNAEPYSTELSSRAGLYALPDIKDILPSARIHYGRLSRPLHNPMWRLLEPQADGRMHKTFHLPSPGAQGPRSRLCDNILVSEHFVGTGAILPTIERTLCNTQLTVKRTGNPKLSDHLPVQLSLRVEEVAACQATSNA